MGGITVYGTENKHYDLFIRRKENRCEVVLTGDTAELIIRSDSVSYRFSAREHGSEVC